MVVSEEGAVKDYASRFATDINSSSGDVMV